MPFFKFPRTPHLAWLGTAKPRDDKVLTADEVRALLSRSVVVEEKVDGANLGLSVDSAGELRAQNRGAYLYRNGSRGQFREVFRWLDARRAQLTRALVPGLVLFGEWCWAQHSIHYSRLPDWFLAFDVYDVDEKRFWSADRRSSFTRSLGIAEVPRIAAGQYSLPELCAMIGRSRLTDGPAEGIYVRADVGEHNCARAKIIAREFSQAIGDHWTHRPLRMNRLERSACR